MNGNLLVPSVEMGDPTPPALHKEAVLHWNAYSNGYHEERSHALSASAFPSSFQANGQPSALRVRPYLKTDEIGPVTSGALREIVWEQEATLLTFALDPTLLAGIADERLPRVTGELRWTPCQAQPASFILSVHPILLVHLFHETCPTEHIEIAPDLRKHDPLLHHMALVLQAEIEGEGIHGRFYVETLVDALAVHFLRRYGASRRSQREVTGGLSPYKLRRTTAYIRDHLEQELSLATLAAVGGMSPAHFARLFKHTTGLTPHQYVIARRMEQAKRLLIETDLPLSEIGLQIGCADQSHFTALFRSHVSFTPKAYRDHAKSEDSTVRARQATVP